MKFFTDQVGGGVRPIAMDGTVRRLAAKCLLSRTLPTCSEYLLPLQVGVQVPNAPETVARAIKQWAGQAGHTELLLQLDLKNAFNSLDRSRSAQAGASAFSLGFEMLRATGGFVWGWLYISFFSGGPTG